MRLGPSPKTENIKLTFLDRYAAARAQKRGEAADATTLIPHMLEAFMAEDQRFKKRGGAKAQPQKPG